MENDFNTIMVSEFSEDELNYNGGWHHPIKNGKLYIMKNNVTIELNEQEIRELSKTIGSNFKLG